MSVYLDGSSVLLNGGSIATDATCCCGGDTGACCADGVCSITTFDECTGNYLGNGTTCDGVDCTQGACCATDGTCSILSSNDCAISGGQYQGNGSTCDGVDCSTGACCVAGLCSQQTEADCTGSGGTFLAYGTPCIPDPCQECACGGFLNPCDGLYYKTKSVSASGNYHLDGDPFNPSNDWDFTSDVTYSCADGVVTCSGSGTGNFYIDGMFVENVHGDCGESGGDSNTYMSLDSALPWWRYGGSGNCSNCPKAIEWSLINDNCDSQHYEVTSPSLPPRSGTFDSNISYSDPCVPV